MTAGEMGTADTVTSASSAPASASASARASASAPVPSTETLLVGTITPGHLVQQSRRPRSLDGDEYLASLPSGGPGAPSYVIGRRVSGEPYRRVVLHFGPTDRPWQRTWELCTDRGSEVDYRILTDTSSSGFAATHP
jgi:hypothetical protein